MWWAKGEEEDRVREGQEGAAKPILELLGGWETEKRRPNPQVTPHSAFLALHPPLC